MKFNFYFKIALLSIAGMLAVVITHVSCGSQFDMDELARIRAVTCPSLCAVYDEAKDAGVEITPEDEALIGGCECQ